MTAADHVGRGGKDAPVLLDRGSHAAKDNGMKALLHRLPVETYVLAFTVLLWIVLTSNKDSSTVSNTPTSLNH